ncbi:hypothetical protein D9758_012286 [Tetrapyrgos nigripes]|uniref:Uncharacterized protein n=1 Tax=Tetrapyrgos nigripes TaxID=182062 RepID=A0A8H5FLU3_9AGAR|nr:hypothetical protein D9758_012286 [Tetrapyrgos nigripes]
MSSTNETSKRIALVTGAGQGIGEAIALRLAKDGIDVAVNDIPGNTEKVTAVSEKIIAMGRQSSVHIADVSVEDQVEKMISGVVGKHGGLDVMIANAGIVMVQPLVDTTVEQWDRIFAVNVRGVFLCYKYAAKQMIAQGRGGRMVAACSVAGKRGNTGVEYSAYCGTKFAVRGITQAAAEHMDQRMSELHGAPRGDMMKNYAARSLLGHNGTPEDVAGLVSYLVSKEAHFVTGQGIGEAIALRLAKDGLDIALNDIPGNLEKVKGVSEKIVALGRKSSIHLADVSLEDQVKNMVEEVVKEHGGLDVMIANAGIILIQPFLETTVEQLDRLHAVNVRGLFLCYQYAAKQMIAQGRGGRLVGACSMGGKIGTNVNFAAYCGSKFAVRGITQAAVMALTVPCIIQAWNTVAKRFHAMEYYGQHIPSRAMTVDAAEFARYKITANAYAPGITESPMGQTIDLRAQQLGGTSPGDALKAWAKERTLLGYNAVPDDIAALVSYLVSEEAHFVTGQTV